MKQFILTFILLIFSSSLISSKLRSSKDMMMLDKLSKEVKDFKSNMNELDSQEKESKNSNINKESSEIIDVAQSLTKNFEEYKSITENPTESKILFTQQEDYLYKINHLISEISQTVTTLVKVDNNDEKKVKIQNKVEKIQEKKNKLTEAKENLIYLRNFKNQENLLKDNKEKAKNVMSKLIRIYNEYLSIEGNLKNNLTNNLEQLEKDFKESDNLLSNFDFFSTLLDKMEKFFVVLEESKTNQEDKEKLQKFKKFIDQTSQLDELNKNLNLKIESEIAKLKNISNNSDRVKSLNKLVKISEVLKTLNLKVLQLKDEVCNKIKNSLETNLDKVVDMIKNSNTEEEGKTPVINAKSILKIKEDHKNAVDNLKSKILSHLSDVQNLIKSNLTNLSKENFKDEKLGLGKLVLQKFSLIDSHFEELKDLNKTFDEKHKMKVNELIEKIKRIMTQLKELAANSKNILNILKKTNDNQKAIQEQYSYLNEKIQNLKTNLQSADVLDHNTVDQMKQQLHTFSKLYENLKTGEIQTSIQSRSLKRLVNTNEGVLSNLKIEKLTAEITRLNQINNK